MQIGRSRVPAVALLREQQCKNQPITQTARATLRRLATSAAAHWYAALVAESSLLIERHTGSLLPSGSPHNALLAFRLAEPPRRL
jgi:hypothetical protein